MRVELAAKWNITPLINSLIEAGVLTGAEKERIIRCPSLDRVEKFLVIFWNKPDSMWETWIQVLDKNTQHDIAHLVTESVQCAGNCMPLSVLHHIMLIASLFYG